MSKLKAGDIVPEFCLPDASGNNICIKDFKGKNIILYFYPKDNTPGCTTEACEFNENYEEFNIKNALIIGISPDSSKRHKSFIEKYNLKQILLADEEHKIISLFGQWVKKKLYGKESEGVNRSTFLISKEGKILYIWDKVKASGHASEVKNKFFEICM